MRRLLQNKYAVAGLSVLAFALVGWRVHGLMNPGMAQVSAREVPQKLVAPGEVPGKTTKNATEKTRPLLRFDLGLGSWRSLFPKQQLKRDPFAVAETPIDVVDPGLHRLLNLQAISVEPSGGLTVINGQLLGEGEQIAQFEIEKIYAEEVWLRGTNGRHVLRFEYSSRAPDETAD